MKHFIAYLSATTLLVFFATALFAQKLPNIQQTGLRAPANVKVDGKPTEWNNKFQAYNHSTDIFYAMANDDNYLYLAIQAVDPAIINKIINGRISFTINKSGKKTDNDAVTISYPIFDAKNKPGVNLRETPEFTSGSVASLKKADSIMYLNNTRMTDRAKMIKVTGIKGMDSLISVYNEDGIKAAALFDNKMVYTCEISIALKLLNLSVNNTSKLSYHVTLNGISIDDMPGISVTRSASGQITSIDVHRDEAFPNAQGTTEPTDFWGDYILVKK